MTARRLPVVMNRRARRKHWAKLEKHLEATLASRPCDGCTACCTALGVGELDKAPGVCCEHVGQGCSIYDTRPPSCREFLCSWRLGVGTLEERPDRIGVVLSPLPAQHPGHPGCQVHEVWPGAFREATDFLAVVAQVFVVFLVQDGLPRRILGPEPRMMDLERSGFLDEIRRMNAADRAARSA